MLHFCETKPHRNSPVKWHSLFFSCNPLKFTSWAFCLWTELFAPRNSLIFSALAVSADYHSKIQLKPVNMTTFGPWKVGRSNGVVVSKGSFSNSNWTEWRTFQGVIARVVSKSDEQEALGRFEITNTITSLYTWKNYSILIGWEQCSSSVTPVQKV